MPVYLESRLVTEEIITLREAAEKCGLSVSHLRLLARSGRLKARKIGRDWVTTLDAVERYLKDEYLRSRSPYKSRGPRPKK